MTRLNRFLQENFIRTASPINGSIINALTRAGIPALPNYAVHPWDRALGDWRPLASARTNDLGRYRMTYNSARFKEWGKTRAANASAS